MKEMGWSPDLGVVMPVDGNKIAGFETWICWNGFDPIAHSGFDFACYLRKDNRIILGLPKLEVCSILDGTVKDIFLTTPFSGFFSTLLNGLTFRNYFCTIVIEHEIGDQKLYSAYSHVNPLVVKGQRVKKGNTIAKLYKSPGNHTGYLVHLHFALSRNNPIVTVTNIPRSIRLLRKLLKIDMRAFGKDYPIDPAIIFPSLTSYLCDPQCSPEFSIPRLGFESTKPIIANFKILALRFNPRT